MIRKHKWVEGAQPDDPVSRVAADVVARRLELCWYYLPLAAEKYEDDVEYVHQLRVASRRAMAALETFADTLPPKRGPKTRRWVRKLRQAAGPARDDDVLAQRLEKLQKNKKHRAGAKRLLRDVLAHRKKSQAAIEQFHARSLEKKIPSRLERLAAGVRWRGAGPEPSFRQAGDDNLRRLLESFQAAAAADLSEADALHELRIEGKRLRYAMEIFHEAYPPAFRQELYPLVEEAQSRLGEINDHATAAARLSAWAVEQKNDAAAETLTRIAANHDDDFATHRAEFLAWWQEGPGERISAGLAELCS